MGQFIGNKDIYDNCPIWLKINKVDWGAKPFKTNNCWFNNKDLLKFMRKEWNVIKVEGRSDFVIKEKLKILKVNLRRWNK